MNLTELLQRIPTLETYGAMYREVSGIVFDSRKAVENSLYVALKGTVADGHSFIDSAVEKGAKVIVCEVLPENLNPESTYIKVKDSSKTLGQLASNYYGNPSEQLTLVGITGTNGKTSVSTLLFDVFTALGFKCALISTVEYRIAGEVIPSTHTTPDVVTLNQILAKAVYEGCEYAFMEVSSHGIHQNRTEGLHFKVGGFTNITPVSYTHLRAHET